MPPRPSSHRQRLPLSGRRTLRELGPDAFTLIEISIVIFIISLLAALAVPALKRAQMEARSAAVANDLRVFAAAFQAYTHEHGDWPLGDGSPGAFPAGMEESLGRTSWERVTPIGGHYTWDPNSTHQGERLRAAIVIASANR